MVSVSGAVILSLQGSPIGNGKRFTIADAIALEKGDILVMSGASVVNAKKSSANNEVFACIASSEKVASDGSTTIGGWTKGDFDLMLSGTCNPGDKLKVSGANQVAIVDNTGADVSGSHIVGTAQEAGTDATRVSVAVGFY